MKQIPSAPLMLEAASWWGLAVRLPRNRLQPLRTLAAELPAAALQEAHPSRGRTVPAAAEPPADRVSLFLQQEHPALQGLQPASLLPAVRARLPEAKKQLQKSSVQ